MEDGRRADAALSALWQPAFRLTRLIIDYVAGRMPVIVTTSHVSSRVAAARSWQAQEAGVAMVMLMAPYHRRHGGQSMALWVLASDRLGS